MLSWGWKRENIAKWDGEKRFSFPYTIWKRHRYYVAVRIAYENTVRCCLILPTGTRSSKQVWHVNSQMWSCYPIIFFTSTAPGTNYSYTFAYFSVRKFECLFEYHKCYSILSNPRVGRHRIQYNKRLFIQLKRYDGFIHKMHWVEFSWKWVWRFLSVWRVGLQIEHILSSSSFIMMAVDLRFWAYFSLIMY